MQRASLGAHAMTGSLSFTWREGGEIQAKWTNGSRAIVDLDDLRVIFGLYEQFDYDGLKRIGLLAAFLCWTSLNRSGMEMSEPNIMRTLDEYDFVVDDHLSQEAFLRGPQEGVDLIREDPENCGVRVWRKLG